MPLLRPKAPCKHCPSDDPQSQMAARLRTTSSWCMEGMHVNSYPVILTSTARVLSMPLVAASQCVMLDDRVPALPATVYSQEWFDGRTQRDTDIR